MTLPPNPAIDAELPALLKRLHEQLAAGDAAGGAATIEAIGSPRLAAAPTLVAALCLGGTSLAVRVAAGADPSRDAAANTHAVLDALCTLIEPPPGAPADHEQRVAQGLIDGFGLEADAASLLDLARAEFLIAEGPPAEVPEAVLAAMRHQAWELALRGLTRVRASLGAATPRATYGTGAMCLHKLGRYREAEQWAQEGLGDQRSLLAIGPVKTEAELMGLWGKHRCPTVSIVCTTYNHERYVEQAIRGFLSQDCPYPFEILIHDDASTDGTQDIVRDWQRRYPNVIRPVLQTENQFSKGVRPFELLLARARGEFVACCEGDDFWIEPGKLRKQVGFLQRHPDVSCSAHNYLHFHESTLTVRPWSRIGKDFFLSQRALMGVQTLLWFPTLVFRRHFSVLPPERDFAAFGDQFLTSYLGTFGRCAYFETMTGAVRRENEFSMWSPLSKTEKERRRVKTWAAMLRLHERLGNRQAVDDVMAKITASTLDAATRDAIVEASARACAPALAAA